MAEHEQETISWFAGVDWGSERHQVCLLDARGTTVGEREFPHSGEGLAELGDWLLSMASAASTVAVAIEVPHGPVVDALIDRGFVVYAVNPKQLDRLRDRFTVAGAKDDRRDAYVIASSLRTDRMFFRPIKLGDAKLVELRELLRMHEDLTAECVMLGNRLRDQLQRFYPQVVALGRVHDERWLWALLDRAPTPALAAHVSLAKIRTILREHRVRRFAAEDVKKALCAPALRVEPGVTEASQRHIAHLLPRLRLADSQRRDVLGALESLLDELSEDSDGRNEQ